MIIKSLKLCNFRNYSFLDLDFSENLNIIYGDNAQGKTNILESLFLCSSGRSHRTNRDLELIRYDNKGFSIGLLLKKRNDSDLSIELSYDKENSKKIMLNGIKIKKIGNLMGNLITVMFSPEDLDFIKEGPSERRKFIDIAISQLKPSYFFYLQEYNRVLKQRNNLLKKLSEDKSLEGTLDIWNISLVKSGSKIITTRYQFLKEINKILKQTHYKLTDNKEDLIMDYTCSFKFEDSDSLNDIESKFEQQLSNSLRRDIFKGSTIYGPHRDDYDIKLNNKSLKVYGSQGQQRTSVLSLKLSQIEIIKKEIGEYPILLLDDVTSELDNKRQSYLFNNLSNIQTFITCTDKSFFENRFYDKIKFINIEDGKVSKT